MNTFGYVGGNSVRYADPAGLSPALVLGGGGSGLGVGAALGGGRPGNRTDPTTGLPNSVTGMDGQSSPRPSSTSDSSATDKSGAKVSADAKCPPPGNCNRKEQEDLQKDVDEACRQPRACRPGMDQITIQINISNGLQCALARSRINNKCFFGGDVNHRNEAIVVWGTVANCQGMVR